MGWLIALALLVAMFYYRNQLIQLRGARGHADRRASQHRDLLYLRLQIQRMAKAGDLETGPAHQLLQRIDWAAQHSLSDSDGGDDQADPSSEQARLNLAWRSLHLIEGSRPEAPPWSSPEPAPKAPTPVTTSQQRPSAPAAEPAPRPTLQAPASGPPSLIRAAQPPTDAEPPAPATPPPATTPAAPPRQRRKPAAKPAKATGEGFRHAWAAHAPNPLELALRSFSRLPKALLPFLLQNIGWFIGAFCFVSGSIFLVAYTGGFVQTLIIYGSLLSYTLFILWAGYRLRVKRRELTTASGVLLTIGMLLVPLNLSTSTRALLEASANPWLLLLGLVLALLTLGIFYAAAQLVSGINDRALVGEHPRLFLLLAAFQLTLPLLARWPLWPLLALVHSLILSALGYAVWRFAQDWVHSIFVQRRKVGYFAAGTLLYAALISFVHLTWGAAPTALPQGYYGPYLMALCTLLFYVDAQLKGQAQGRPLLSRLNFATYGLSVVALLVALPGPGARLLTLVLGAALYAWVTWRYLTLIPLYLLLACLTGLYHQLLLQHFTLPWWLLLGLPGLLLLLTTSRHIAAQGGTRRGARRLALMSYRLFMLLLLLTAAASLVTATPGPLALSSALALAAGCWWGLASAPGPLLPQAGEQGLESDFGPAELDLRNGPWLYTVTLALALAGYFVPPLLPGPWGVQLGLALLLLAGLWTWIGLGLRRSRREAGNGQVEVLINSALLTGLAALAAATSGLLLTGSSGNALLPLLLAALAGLALWLSLALYSRGLFYLSLLLAAGAGVLAKLLLFPGHGTGLAPLLAGFGLWLLLQRLDRQPDELTELRRRRAQQTPPLTLLWVFPRRRPDAEQEVAPDA